MARRVENRSEDGEDNMSKQTPEQIANAVVEEFDAIKDPMPSDLYTLILRAIQAERYDSVPERRKK